MVDCNINSLSKTDLIILMNSYKSTIELNTILIEQQKNLINQINDLAKNQNDVYKNLDSIIEHLEKINNSLQITKNDIILKCWENCGKLKDSASSIHEGDINLSKEHQGIRYRINLIYVGMSAIVFSLVIVIIKIYEKIEDILHLIKK